jgi:hypothetical protein
MTLGAVLCGGQVVLLQKVEVVREGLRDDSLLEANRIIVDRIRAVRCSHCGSPNFCRHCGCDPASPPCSPRRNLELTSLTTRKRRRTRVLCAQLCFTAVMCCCTRPFKKD